MAPATRAILVDIPDAAFEAVLQHITAADVASLRQVSSDICRRTTYHIPYVCLRLSGNSSSQYLDAWCEATKRLQHVQAVHVRISNSIPAEEFDAAIASLSKQRDITTLQLIGVHKVDNHNSLINSLLLAANYTCCIASLYPIRHLASSLKTLVITDLAIEDLPSDLQQLNKEPAGTFQLQSLTLKAAWTGKGEKSLGAAGFWTVLMRIADTFPCLQHLNLGVPWTSSHIWDLLKPALAELPGLWEGEKLQVIGIMAGVAKAVSHLQHLQALTVSDMPDPCTGFRLGSKLASDEKLWRQACYLTADNMYDGTSSRDDAALDPDFVRSLPLAAAAAACSTMDTVGYWLLQQQPKLMHVHLGCGGWWMSWTSNRKQLQQPPCSGIASASTASTSAAAPETELVAIKAQYSISDAKQPGSVDCSSVRSSMIPGAFERYLFQYTHCPAATLVRLISRLELLLYSDCWFGDSSLLGLMGSLQSLKELEVSLTTGSEKPDGFVAAVLTAAAAVPGLQIFKLKVSLWGSKSVCITDSMLLPLTAAAGGPRALEVLHIDAKFEPGAHEGASGWFVLQQLRCLKELSIKQSDKMLMMFPANSLPTSLEKFRGRWLHLELGAPAAASADPSPVTHAASSPDNIVAAYTAGSATAEQQPQLYALDIQFCLLGHLVYLQARSL